MDVAIAHILDVQPINSQENPFQDYIEEQVKGGRRGGSFLGRSRPNKALIPPIQAAKLAMSSKNSHQMRQVQQKLAQLEHLRNQMEVYSRSNVQGGLGGQIEELRSWGLVHASQSSSKGNDDFNLASRSLTVDPARLQGPYIKANLSKFAGGRAHHRDEQTLENRDRYEKSSPRHRRALQDKKGSKFDRTQVLDNHQAYQAIQAQILTNKQLDSRERTRMLALADAVKAHRAMGSANDLQWQDRNDEKRANTKSADGNTKQVLVQSRHRQQNENETLSLAKQAYQHVNDQSYDQGSSKTKQFYHSQMPTPSTWNNTEMPSQQKTPQPFRMLSKNKPDAPFTPVPPKLSLQPHAQPSHDGSWLQSRKQSSGSASEHRLPSPESTPTNHTSMQPKFRTKLQTGSNTGSKLSNFGNRLKSLPGREGGHKGQTIVIQNKNMIDNKQDREETLEGHVGSSGNKGTERASPGFKEDSQAHQRSQRSTQSQNKQSQKEKNFFKSNFMQKDPSLRKWDGSAERFGIDYLQNTSAADGAGSTGPGASMQAAGGKGNQSKATGSQQLFQRDPVHPLAGAGKTQMSGSQMDSTAGMEKAEEIKNQLILLSPHRSPRTMLSNESKKSQEGPEYDAAKEAKESANRPQGAEGGADPYILITNLKDYREGSHGKEQAVNEQTRRGGQMTSGSPEYSEQKRPGFQQLRSKDSLQHQEQGDQGQHDDSRFKGPLVGRKGERLSNAHNKGPVQIKEMRLVSLDRGSQLFKKERKSLPISTRTRQSSRHSPPRTYKGDNTANVDSRQMWEVVSPTLVPMLPPPRLAAPRPDLAEKSKNWNLPSVISPKGALIRDSLNENNQELIMISGVRSPGADTLLQHDPKRDSGTREQAFPEYDNALEKARNLDAASRAHYLTQQATGGNMTSKSGQPSPKGLERADIKNAERQTIIENAERLKMDLQIDLGLLRERQCQDQQVQAEHLFGNDLYDEVNRTKNFTPNASNNFAKQLRPVYIFRDELDVSKIAEKRQNDIVLRKFGLRSLSHVAHQQRSINKRIHSLVQPNKRAGAPNYSKKLQSFQNELQTSFYSNVSDQITTMRTTGRNLGRGEASTLEYRHGNDVSSPRQQTFQASISYGQPKKSVIVDNRSTSLFRDYYKVIGARYKFQLEDLLSKQAGTGPTNMRHKFASFQDRLSAHHMNERNSSNTHKDLFDKYKKYDGFQDSKKERSPRMTLEEMGLEHLALKDINNDDRKLQKLVVEGLPGTATPSSNGDDQIAPMILYSTLDPLTIPGGREAQNQSNQTLGQPVDFMEKDATFDQPDPAQNHPGSLRTAGQRDPHDKQFGSNHSGFNATQGITGQNVQMHRKKKRDEQHQSKEHLQNILKHQNPFSSRNQSQKGDGVLAAKSTDRNSRSDFRSKDEHLADDMNSTFRKSDDQDEQPRKSLHRIQGLRLGQANKNKNDGKVQSNADLQSHEAGKDRNSLLTGHESKATTNRCPQKTETTVHSQVDNQASSVFRQIAGRQDTLQGDNRSQRTLSRGERSGPKDHALIRKGDHAFGGHPVVFGDQGSSSKPRHNISMMDQISPKVVMNRPKQGGFRPPTQELSSNSIDKIENQPIVHGVKSVNQQVASHLDQRLPPRQIFVQNPLADQISRRYENFLMGRDVHQQSPRHTNQLIKQPKIIKIKNAGKVEIVGRSIRINSRMNSTEGQPQPSAYSPRAGAVQVVSHSGRVSYASPHELNLLNTIITSQMASAEEGQKYSPGPGNMPLLAQLPINTHDMSQIYADRLPRRSPQRDHQGLRNKVVANALSSAEKLTLLQRVASPIDKIIIQQNSQSLEVLRNQGGANPDAGQTNIIINDNMCNSKKQSEFEISEATEESNLLVNTLNLTARQEFSGEGDEPLGLDAKGKRKYPSGHFKPLANTSRKQVLGGGFGQSSKNLQKLIKEQKTQQSQTNYSPTNSKAAAGAKSSSSRGQSLGPVAKGTSSKKVQQFLPAPQKAGAK